MCGWGPKGSKVKAWFCSPGAGSGFAASVSGSPLRIGIVQIAGTMVHYSHLLWENMGSISVFGVDARFPLVCEIWLSHVGE